MRRRLATVLIAAALVPIGCGGTVGSATPGATGKTSLIPAATSTAAPDGSGKAAGQTDTDWGRIWDAVPAGFLRYPGSTPSEEAASGPASATLVVTGDVAGKVATFVGERLRAEGYGVDGATTPLEDGSYTIEATGAADCRVQVTAAPTGDLTTITILYGAACPDP